MLKKVTITLMFISILSLMAHQKGFFLAEPVLASVCKPKLEESSEEKVHLIELFTSEGCSSCPPAEKWLNSLRNNPDLGKSFFPIGFHVDYWDYIGWKDPLAKAENTVRQRNYAAIWKNSKIYTPGFVLNGKEWRGLAVKSVPKASSKKVGVLRAKALGNRKFKISFTGKSTDLNLNYALLGNGIISKVKAGENKGKVLKQYFAVLEARSQSFSGNEVEITIPSSKVEAKEYMMTVWLSHKRTLETIQVLGTCL